MNNDVKDLMLAKKEKINEWLEYLNTEYDDIIWIQKSRVFSTGIYNIIYKLQKIESNDLIKKQEELINNIGQYINIGDRLKVKEIVNKLKDLDDGIEISDDIDFNNFDQMITNIDSKLEDIKQEELDGPTHEEQEKINEQWDKEEKEFSNITNSMINNYRESTSKEIDKAGLQNDLNIEKINFGKSNIEINETYIDDNGYERDRVKNIEISNVPMTEHEQLKRFKEENERLEKFKEETLKMQRCDFALIVNSGAILPVEHSDYNNDRVKIEIYDINNHNIEIDGKKYKIKTQLLFNKIKLLIDNNLDLLIGWSKKENNQFLVDNDYYRHWDTRTNIKVKYGQLLININGQVSGELGNNIEHFINNIKELIISESNLNDKDYIINNLVENDQTENNNVPLSDDDKIVNLLVNKIEKMSDGTQFNIIELINMPEIINSEDIDLIGISLDTLKKLDEKGIEIKPTIAGVVGLPQGIPYIKVGKKDKDKS